MGEGRSAAQQQESIHAVDLMWMVGHASWADRGNDGRLGPVFVRGARRCRHKSLAAKGLISFWRGEQHAPNGTEMREVLLGMPLFGEAGTHGPATAEVHSACALHAPGIKYPRRTAAFDTRLSSYRS